MNLRVSIKNLKNPRTKQFKKNLWKNAKLQKNIQKQTLLYAVVMASKVLLTEINDDDTNRIIFLVNFEAVLYIKGHHKYQKIWTSLLQKELCGEMEPAKPVDKYVVAVKKNNVIVGIDHWGVVANLQRQYFTFFVQMNRVNTK